MKKRRQLRDAPASRAAPHSARAFARPSLEFGLRRNRLSPDAPSLVDSTGAWTSFSAATSAALDRPPSMSLWRSNAGFMWARPRRAALRCMHAAW